MTSELGREEKLSLLRDMMRIRAFESKMLELIHLKELEAGFHLLMGHEAIVVGVSHALRSSDYVTSNHRAIGRYLSRGGDSKKIMAEIYGKATGVCRGRAGEMLIADRSKGLLFSSVTVAAGIPVAVGAAISLRLYSKSDHVVATFFGDAATCNGIFHESMNIAAVHKAPIIFVCENNGLSINISQSAWMSTKTVAEKAVAYGIVGVKVDGTDVEAVYDAASEAVDRARRGLGPTLIDAVTVRLRPHKEGMFDNRSVEQLKADWERDPLALYKAKLKTSHILQDSLENEMRSELEQEIEVAVNYARMSPFPEDSELMDNLYSPPMNAAFSRFEEV